MSNKYNCNAITCYNTITNIHKLFTEYNFKPYIASYTDISSNIMSLSYTNLINQSLKFNIDIIDKKIIVTRIPLKNNNYYFTTTHYVGDNIIDFLQLHIDIHQ